MMINLLVDTNVWIYSLDKMSIHYQIAETILSKTNHSLFITSKNISELFAVTSKKKIDFKLFFDSYKKIKTVSNILFPSQESLSIFEYLIQKYEPIGNQVFDIEIVSIMLANDISHIATFNKKDFSHVTEIKILELPDS